MGLSKIVRLQKQTLSSQAVNPCGNHDEAVENFKPPENFKQREVLSPEGRSVGDINTSLEDIRIQEYNGDGVYEIKP